MMAALLAIVGTLVLLQACAALAIGAGLLLARMIR
jgi:hypothetical protein